MPQIPKEMDLKRALARIAAHRRRERRARGLLAFDVAVAVELRSVGIAGRRDTKRSAFRSRTARRSSIRTWSRACATRRRSTATRSTVVDASRDNAKQQSQVEDFISKRVDAIVLTPYDSQAIGSAIVEANNANIPVFTADIASTSSQGNVVAHIASDNVQGGFEAGKLICNAVGKQRQRRDHRRTGGDERARSRQRLQTSARAALSRRDDRRRRRLGRNARQSEQRHRRHPASASRPQGHLRHQRRFGARRAGRRQGRRPERKGRDRRATMRRPRRARRSRAATCTATRSSIRRRSARRRST